MMNSGTFLSCVYCGDSPVNHSVHFIDTTLDIFTKSVFSSRSAFFDIQASPIVMFLSRITTDLCIFLKIVQVSDKISDARTKRTKVVWEEASRRGIMMQQISLFGKKIEESRALLPKKKGSSILRFQYFQSIPIPPWIASGVAGWIDDKMSFKKEFQKEQLKVARGYVVISKRGARKAFRKIGTQVIVKPREGSRARHTAVNIQTEEECVEAFLRARQLCLFVLIEEYIMGDTYRALCIEQKVVAVMKFNKAQIIADGLSSCDALRAHYNENLLQKNIQPVKDDSLYHDTLLHQGLTPLSTPPKGYPLLLAEHSERTNGGYNEDITDTIPKRHSEEIERGARICGIPVIGYDLISKDLEDQNVPFTFIEGNTLPYIEIHHEPTVGTPRDVAGKIWDMWFN
jgi:D-alanine-D-alanine ligase-like ATP-grasp enzyme